MSVYNFAGSGPTLTKLYQETWLEAGVINWTLILQGVSPTKFGRVKNVQNLARFLTVDFDHKYLRINISKIRTVLDQLHFIPYRVKEIW